MRGVWYLRQAREKPTGLWWGNFKKRDHLEVLCVDEDNIKMDLKDIGSEAVEVFV
jgi:hypothetical protein